MIVGVTHNKDLRPVTSRMPELLKLAIGLPGRNGGGPQKLDYIVFKRFDPSTGDWVVDEDLQGKFGKPREVEIVLIHDSPDEAFYTAYELWTSQQVLCRGDGLKALRYADIREAQGQLIWTPLQEPVEVQCDTAKRCPLLESERCRPRGTLYFLLLDHLVLGTVCKLTTTSFRSIRNIYSTLALIYRARGTVKWLPLKLGVEAVTAYPKARGRKKTINLVWTLKYEGLVDKGQKIKEFLRGLSRENLEDLEAGVRAHKQLESAAEIQEEFYPLNARAVQSLPQQTTEGEEEWTLF